MISIIIPTYKRHKQLQNAIKSVLNQTYKDFELIIVNDYTDNLEYLVKEFNDIRIKIIYNNREKGANGARNTGILFSGGIYIAFLDDDDEWFPEKLEMQIIALTSLGEDWGGTYCGFKSFDYGGWAFKQNLKSGILFPEILTGENDCNAGSTLLVKRNALLDTGLFSEELQRHQDLEFLIRFFRKFKLLFVNEILVIINGHSTFDPNVIEQNKIKLFDIIENDIKLLSKHKRNLMFAFQYRELSLLFSRQGQIKKTIFYLKLSLKSKILPPFRYISIILNVLGFLLNINVDRYINYFKMKISKM